MNSFIHRSGGLDFNGHNLDVDYFSSFTSSGISGVLRTIDMSNAALRVNTGLCLGAGKLISINSTNSAIIVRSPNARGTFRGAPNLSSLQLNDIYFTATTGTVYMYVLIIR